MKISFVIVNHKSEALLQKCLESLRPCMKAGSCEVVIVNNDETTLKEDFANFQNIRVINNRVNHGFAKACNIGAASSAGKYLFFLNPDTELKFSNIADLVSGLDKKDVGIIAPKLITLAESVQPWSAGYEINLWEIIRKNLGHDRSEKIWKQDLTDEIDWVSGAALVITKHLFDSCGGFDENFFMYFEDVDLCKRVKTQKQKIVRLTEFTVLHVGGQSYTDKKKQKEQYYISQDYYFKKHFGMPSLFFLKLLRTFSSAFKLES